MTVADVMQAAGLTHGGFYRHFASKDDLAVAACRRAFAQTAKVRATWVDAERSGAKTLAALRQRYLSRRHRDHSGKGCPIPALAVDVARAGGNAALRDAYTEGLQGVIEEVAALLRVDGMDETLAPGVMATLAGAIMLSRATQGNPLSERVLESAGRFLVSALSTSPVSQQAAGLAEPGA